MNPPKSRKERRGVKCASRSILSLWPFDLTVGNKLLEKPESSDTQELRKKSAKDVMKSYSCDIEITFLEIDYRNNNITFLVV